MTPEKIAQSKELSLLCFETIKFLLYPTYEHAVGHCVLASNFISQVFPDELEVSEGAALIDGIKYHHTVCFSKPFESIIDLTSHQFLDNYEFIPEFDRHAETLDSYLAPQDWELQEVKL